MWYVFCGVCVVYAVRLFLSLAPFLLCAQRPKVIGREKQVRRAAATEFKNIILDIDVHLYILHI